MNKLEKQMVNSNLKTLCQNLFPNYINREINFEYPEELNLTMKEIYEDYKSLKRYE